MIRRLTMSLGLFGVVALALVSIPVYAQTTEPSDAQLTRVQQNCATNITALEKLHASDGLARVNSGQIYEQVSSELMSQLNSRIASNRLDDGGMITITAAYQQALTSYRSNYIRYEREMVRLKEINCEQEPRQFYSALVEVRGLRAGVRNDVERLDDLLGQYSAAFEAFAANNNGAAGQ